MPSVLKTNGINGCRIAAGQPALLCRAAKERLFPRRFVHANLMGKDARWLQPTAGKKKQ